MRTTTVLAGLIEEAGAFDAMVAGLSEEDWDTPTPAPGWRIRHHVAHLAFVCRMAAFAVLHPEDFGEPAAGLFTATMADALAQDADDPPEVLLARWRADRDDAIKALASVRPTRVVPWLGGPRPPGTLAAAGMVELFAHGQDVADALGRTPDRSDRLAPAVALAVANRDLAYPARNSVSPGVPFRFVLRAPSGAPWTFGPPGAVNRVVGDAVEFLLLVTRRRHRYDLGVRAYGTEADRWLSIAQAYPGFAGTPRLPGRFRD